jgi:hypothetical protein
MNLDRILTSAPINQTAARVVSRRRGLEEASSMGREEIIEIVARLERKLRLLKLVLGIKTKAQHHNLVWKFNKGFKTTRFKENPRSVIEYKRVGEEMQRLIRRLAEMKKEAKAARALAKPESAAVPQ